MKYKILLLLCFFQIAFVSISAQKHLKIDSVFDKYGKREGAVLLQLSTDILSQGSNITLFKSLVTKRSKQYDQEVIDALKIDTREKTIISEVNKNGNLESGVYHLGTDKENDEQYILFKTEKDKTTLVYLKGKIDKKNLDNELKNLKDLFLYVNNKRIKIQ